MSEYLYDYNGELNYKFGKTIDNTCHTSYDPSIIKNNKSAKSKSDFEKEHKERMSQLKDLSGHSKFAQASLSSAMGKDERKFKLKTLINEGRCKTLKSASKLIGVSEKTIVSYLKEMNIRLYDTSKQKYVGSNNKDAKQVKI